MRKSITSYFRFRWYSSFNRDIRGLKSSNSKRNWLSFQQNHFSNTCYTVLLQLGVALGFVVPPMLVTQSEDVVLLGEQLRILFYIVAGVTSVLLVMILFCEST